MWQEKQTKAIINKETIKKELLAEQKATAPIILVLGILCMLSALLMWSGGSVIMTVVMAVIGAGIIICDCYMIGRIIKCRFDVIEDHLVRMAEDEPIRRGKRISYCDVFYFSRTGRYIVTGADKSAWHYSSEDDKFYVVVMRGKNITPMKVYNSKVYEYRED